MPSNPRDARGRGGLTLLEVLAAVVIVGITYAVVFFPSLSESLLREGENKRRIRATLLADETLAGIEADVDRGLVPQNGLEEREVDEFSVEIETGVMTLELPAHERGAPYGNLRPDPNGLLGSAARPDASTLRRIDVRVSWVEGFSDRKVERVTFAFDPSGAQAVLQTLIDAALGDALGGTQGDNEDAEPTQP